MISFIIYHAERVLEWMELGLLLGRKSVISIKFPYDLEEILMKNKLERSKKK